MPLTWVWLVLTGYRYSLAILPPSQRLKPGCLLSYRPSRPEDSAVEKNGLNDEIWGMMICTWAQQPERRPLTRHTALVSLSSEHPAPSRSAQPFPSFPDPHPSPKASLAHLRSLTVSSMSSGGSQGGSTYSAQRSELCIAPAGFYPTPSLQSLSTISSGLLKMAVLSRRPMMQTRRPRRTPSSRCCPSLLTPRPGVRMTRLLS